MSFNNTQNSYASATTQGMFSTKDCAIVIDAIDEIPVREYTLALAKKIDSSSIKAVSRISQKRICFYLSNTSQVMQITQNNNNELKIGSRVLKIKPLTNATKRIIFSNVFLDVTHQMLHDKLIEYGITPRSSITFIRAGYNDTGLSHINSFRRQVYIDEKDLDKLPSDFKNQANSTTWHIFVSTDIIKCFVCKSESHTSKHCPSNNVNSTETFSNLNKINSDKQKIPESPKPLTSIESKSKKDNPTEETIALDSTTENMDFEEFKTPQDPSSPTKKRPLSVVESTISSLDSNSKS